MWICFFCFFLPREALFYFTQVYTNAPKKKGCFEKPCFLLIMNGYLKSHPLASYYQLEFEYRNEHCVYVQECKSSPGVQVIEHVEAKPLTPPTLLLPGCRVYKYRFLKHHALAKSLALVWPHLPNYFCSRGRRYFMCLLVEQNTMNFWVAENWWQCYNWATSWKKRSYHTNKTLN